MILWADSFDHYGAVTTNMTDGAYAEVAGITLSTTQARTGTRSIRMAAGAVGTVRRVFGAAYETAGVAMAVYAPALPTLNDRCALIEFRDAANAANVSIGMQTTGALTIYRGTGIGGTLLATSSALVTANAWNHIEAAVFISNTIGTVEVRLNGVTVVTFAGDTQATANAETSQWARLNGGGGAETYMDDIIAWEADSSGDSINDFIGDRKVYTDFPDADTADVDWTPSAGGSRFGVIDETPPNGDTDYATASVAGDVMGVTFPDIDGAIVGISAIILIHKTKKTDAGTCDVQMAAVQGSSVEDGVDRPMTTAYTLYHDVFETDPNTTAPWTPGGANTMAARLTRTA